MARTLVTGRAQTVTTEDFNERVRVVLIDKVYPLKSRVYRTNFKAGFPGGAVK